jgi:peptidoglycan hydrolase-like protein with peptidoglycan-binding domain
MSAWIKDKVFANGDEFLKWLDENFGDYISKHIVENHVHHTYIPNHSHYANGKTTLQLHQGIRNSHINGRGWDDIGQHITVGKDGDIVLGRDIQKVPCSATGYNGNSNLHPFMYETIGNFDEGNDKLEGKQLDSVVKISSYFYRKGKGIGFHREKLINGKQPKSCPGTGVDKAWFMNLVKGNTPQPTVAKPTPVVAVPVSNVKPTNTTTLPFLHKGDHGESVKQMQTLLNKFGYKLAIDGIFGQASDSAVRDFQKKNKLTIDGIVGTMTWGKLKTTSPITSTPVSTKPAPKYPNKLYKVQSPMLHDENIKLIQQQLNKAAGKQVVKVDGWYGNDTANQVGLFQKKYGLSNDKIVGQKTWDKLFSLQINIL